jgi:hypothetical protein
MEWNPLSEFLNILILVKKPFISGSFKIILLFIGYFNLFYAYFKEMINYAFRKKRDTRIKD